MNIALWVLQILLALVFFRSGVIHFTMPPELPVQLQWMYDLSPTLHTISGVAEIAGALGLILPGIVKIQTRLTPLAAVGLILVMLGAIIFHIPRGEYFSIVMNTVLLILSAGIAYGRWRLAPLPEKE